MVAMLSLGFMPCLKAQHMNAPNAPCQNVGSNADETGCFIAASENANKNLNHLYAQISRILTTAERDQLVAAERLWIRYRDANCDAERGLYGGGSGGPTTYAACIAAVTEARVAELKIIYGWRLEK